MTPGPKDAGVCCDTCVNVAPGNSRGARGGATLELPPLVANNAVPLGSKPAHPTPCSEKALAAQPARIEAFDVRPTFLMDTGSGRDIVSWELAGALSKFTHKARRMSFTAANGEVGSNYTLLMKVGARGTASTP